MTNPLPPNIPGVRVCQMCRHMRARPKVKLFDSQDLESPGALKAQVQWDQDMKQRALLELERSQARKPFDYEPHHFAWCAKYTQIDLVAKAQAGDETAMAQLMTEGGATMDPVTGDIGALYHLCTWHNDRGDCEGYEPK